MRVKLTLQYDGTNYSGWQVQENAVGIQNIVECAIGEICGENVRITGAGRTDKGVHALGQVAHFDTSAKIPGDKWHYHLNVKLPDDIRVIRSEEVSADFHARYNAIFKHYCYTIYVGKHRPPQLRNFAAHEEKLPNLEKMREMIPVMTGTHDFEAFMSQGSPVPSTIRTLDTLRIEWREPFLFLHYEAESFLYNMVRILSGTLLWIGNEKMQKEQVERALRTGERNLAGPTLEACGLTLVKIEYPNGGQI